MHLCAYIHNVHITFTLFISHSFCITHDILITTFCTLLNYMTLYYNSTQVDLNSAVVQSAHEIQRWRLLKSTHLYGTCTCISLFAKQNSVWLPWLVYICIWKWPYDPIIKPQTHTKLLQQHSHHAVRKEILQHCGNKHWIERKNCSNKI